MRRKLLAILLAICIILPAIPVNTYAASEPSEPYSISLGIPQKDTSRTNTWKFPNAELCGYNKADIGYVTLAFSCVPSTGDKLSCTSDPNGQFTVNSAANGYSLTIELQSGKIAWNSDWRDFIQNHFYAVLTDSRKEYSISVTTGTKEDAVAGVTEYLYWAGNGHYYTYIPVNFSLAWTDAYRFARDQRHNGKHGYLLTITSEEEQKYLEKLIGTKNGWTAGTRNSAHFPKPESAVAPNVQGANAMHCARIGKNPSTLLAGNDVYFWADGADDEVGLMYYPSKRNIAGFDNSANKFQYTNWDSQGGAHWQPDCGAEVEAYMQYFGTSACTWNDVSNLADVKGYFVEFGGKSTDTDNAGSRTMTVISLSDATNPTITSTFDAGGTGACTTTVNGSKVTPSSLTLYKKNGSSYQKKDGLDGTGTYMIAVGYRDSNGNTYYSEKLDTVDSLQVTIKLEGVPANLMSGYPKTVTLTGNSYEATAPKIAGYTVDEEKKSVTNIKASTTITFYYTANCDVTVVLEGLETVPTGYPLTVKNIPPGGSYVAEAPEIPGYTVDKAQKTVNDIRASTTVTFYYTPDCSIKVMLEGLAEEDIPEGWADGQTTAVKKGEAFTATAPTVEGYLVDRYSATIDPVMNDETIVFHYAKEGVGNKGRNVQVKLRDTDGKTLSVDGYATKYVVEKGAPIKIVAPVIDGYALKEGSFTPKTAKGYTLSEGVFNAEKVTQNTTVTFIYEKQPDPPVPPEPQKHTVTVVLEKHDGDEVTTETHETATVSEGDSYTAIAPQIPGYTVDMIMETVPNVMGDTTIKFTYTKPKKLELCEVTVELWDKTDEEHQERITPPEGFVSTYYITKGGGFSLTHPALDGYRYEGSTDNAAIAPLLQQKETVKFFYTKPTTSYTVTVRLEGASLDGYPLEVEVPAGEQYTAIAPMIDGKKVDKYSETVTVDHDGIEIVFTYKKLKGPSTPKPEEEEPPESPVGGVLNTDDHIRYMAGHASGLFGPEGDLTRAQCAQIFYNLLLDKDAAQRVSFPDVPEDKWYARAIETLAGMDVLQGYNDGTFQPEKSITRAEFTAIAMRFGELDRSGENPFPDVTEDRWYYSDVVGSAKYGWIQGYTDGTFRPEEKISRTEVTYIVNRMLQRTADQGYIDANPEALASFPDLPSSYWGYYSIMEATNAHDHTWKDKSEVWTKIR